MKEINIKGFFPLLALLLLSSCMKEIDLEHLRAKPRLVLNGALTAGQPVAVNLSRTWFYTEEKPDLNFPDADVRLYVNDQLQEQLVWYEGDTVKLKQGYFRGTYIPQLGDRLKVTAAVSDYPDVSAETNIPETPTVLKLTSKTELVERSGWASYYQFKLQFTFQDDPNRTNFYLIRFEYKQVTIDKTTGEEQPPYGGYGQSGGWSEMSMDYTSDPLFSSSLTALDKILGYDWMSYRYGRVFSDDLINGKAYTVNLSSTSHYGWTDPSDPNQAESNYIARMYCRAVLYTLTEPYYRYMKAIIEMEDDNTQQTMIDAGMAEPIQIYSNVTDGVGILGGCNLDTMEVQVY